MAIGLMGLIAAPSGGRAQSADTYDLLPDRYYVKTECTTLADAASAYPALKSEGDAVRSICDRDASDSDGSAWLTAIEPHAGKIRAYDPNTGLYAGTTLNGDQRIPATYKVLRAVPRDIRHVRQRFAELQRALRRFQIVRRRDRQ
jgi:hypothetical protein